MDSNENDVTVGAVVVASQTQLDRIEAKLDMLLNRQVALNTWQQEATATVKGIGEKAAPFIANLENSPILAMLGG